MYTQLVLSSVRKATVIKYWSLTLIALMLLDGCSASRRSLVAPGPPKIPDSANFYKNSEYQTDITAYTAAAEGNMAIAGTGNCPATGAAARAAVKLAFCSLANGAAGSALSGSVVIQVEDADNNLVTSATNSITLTSAPAGISGTVTVSAVAGVATFNHLTFGNPNTYTLTAATAGLTNATSGNIIIVAAGSPPPVSDLDRAKYFRNKIANNYMGDIDYVYGDYTDALFTGKGWESFIGDATALGFSTASTISAVARTKTILSALGSAVTGISLSADKNFFSQQTFQALAIAMQARRDQARQTIISNLQLTVTDYPLAAVRRDLVSYFYAGTLPGALQEIQMEAAITSHNANNPTGAPSPKTPGAPTCPTANGAAGAGTTLVFCAVANGSAGSALAPVIVEVADAHNNLVTSATNSVTIASNPPGVAGTLTVAAVGGVATFSNLTFANPGQYTLTATSGGLGDGTSGNITIAQAKTRLLQDLH